jgi:hypothetical protein
VVLDVNSINLFEFSQRDRFWHELGEAYRNSMAAAGRIRSFSDVSVIKIAEIDVTELEGPWSSVCWIGPHIFVVGSGEKWGVFFSDLGVCSEVVLESLCIAKALRSSRLLVFPSSGFGIDAYANALEGASFSDIIGQLEGRASMIRLSACAISDYENISSKISQYSDSSDSVYILVDLYW